MLSDEPMSNHALTAEADGVLTSRTVEHADRAFEIQVQAPVPDRCYIEAVIFENGEIVTLPYPGGLMVQPVYGISVARNIGSDNPQVLNTLLDLAEIDIRRLIR